MTPSLLIAVLAGGAFGRKSEKEKNDQGDRSDKYDLMKKLNEWSLGTFDHDKEGSHALIGMEFLKRHGENPEVLNGVGCHHFEIPAESTLAALVNVCDTLSASRPGGRSETTEIYLKRLEQLEEIGYSFDGVNNCYAVQAGREIRVFVEPDKVSEDAAYALSRDIATLIETKMQYPGQIKVCVIREIRSVEYAK